MTTGAQCLTVEHNYLHEFTDMSERGDLTDLVAALRRETKEAGREKNR